MFPETRQRIRRRDARPVDHGCTATNLEFSGHADPRTTSQDDGARKNLSHHPNCILAASVASGT